MACSLIEHKRINTTVAKAKALRSYVEPLITKSKEDTTHNRRIVFSYLRSKYAVTDLFRDVAAKVGDRPGGYCRIIKLGNRLGDNADMAMIELVDFNELYNGGKKEVKKAKLLQWQRKFKLQWLKKPLHQSLMKLQKHLTKKLKIKHNFIAYFTKKRPAHRGSFLFCTLPIISPLQSYYSSLNTLVLIL